MWFAPFRAALPTRRFAVAIRCTGRCSLNGEYLMIATSRNRLTAVMLLAAAGLWPVSSAEATIPYNNPGPFAVPLLNPTSMPGLPKPEQVPGKEYSSNVDSTAGGTVDPGQVVAWDGLGGTADWLDYTETPRPLYAGDDDIDALASFYDTLIDETRADTAHLIFSIDASAGVLPAGPVFLQNNNSQLGGAGDLSYELAGAFPLQEGHKLQGPWASRAQINNSESSPTDIDAIELWGPEPAYSLDERNKYSLKDDYASYNTAIPGDAVSVWNYDGTPFIAHSLIVGVVEELLDASVDDISKIDVDALMVFAINGSPYSFDPDLGTGTDDVILFSIRQITGQSCYYATGSEIFWVDGSGNRGFLHHGGHDWDKDYALQNLRLLDGSGVVDIDALEAVTTPEPSAAVLALVGIFGFRLLGRRRSG
jgi:hypothetical protein